MVGATGVKGNGRLRGKGPIAVAKINRDGGWARLTRYRGDRQIQKSVVIEVSGGECSTERNIGNLWSSETSRPGIGSKHQLRVHPCAKGGGNRHQIGVAAVAKICEQGVSDTKARVGHRRVNRRAEVSSAVIEHDGRLTRVRRSAWVLQHQ